MGDTIWLAAQALGTFAIVIVLALASSTRARQMLRSRWPRKPSALARATPDPQFRPDPEVTDPFHATDAHDRQAQGQRPATGDMRGRAVDRADAASMSMEKPSAVEALDGAVAPAVGGSRDGHRADAPVKSR